uniref:Uncharacterized protein n=1 Tax=Arundo donax TaxID=35708 RepID=A0A0A8XVC8_ARUDO
MGVRLNRFQGRDQHQWQAPPPRFGNRADPNGRDGFNPNQGAEGNRQVDFQNSNRHSSRRMGTQGGRDFGRDGNQRQENYGGFNNQRGEDGFRSGTKRQQSDRDRDTLELGEHDLRNKLRREQEERGRSEDMQRQRNSGPEFKQKDNYGGGQMIDAVS